MGWVVDSAVFDLKVKYLFVILYWTFRGMVFSQPEREIAITRKIEN